jgi:hypothetical protein
LTNFLFTDNRESWLRAADAVIAAVSKIATSLKANFDPSQPRDEQGRWTETGATSGDESFEIAVRKIPAYEAACTAQYAKDTFHCTMVGSRACHTQAALRYGNCLARKPVPPLNY